MNTLQEVLKTKGDMLYQFYQELVAENKWETENYVLILIKGGLRIKDKLTGEELNINK